MMTGIPDYSDVNLEGQSYAGGSNGAYFANDDWNQPWLVKSYPGAIGQDRAASELLANSIYRAVGANTPQMGVRNKNGHISVSYPLAQGEHTYFSGDYGDMAKRQALGHHLATDALLGNWDFAGLDDDNVLWDESGNPIRIDPGGSFEFRAQGAPKEYGPVPHDLNNMLALGQARHGTLTSEEGLRNQASHIGRTLTPNVVHGLVDAAPFYDEKMRERIRQNLLSRVNWMHEFGHGMHELSPEAKETLDHHRELFSQRTAATHGSLSDSFCIKVDVPRHAAKTLFRWARDQDWPKGTELEDFNEYHVTMLHAPYGYQAFHKAWWVPDIEKINAKIVGFDNFGPNEDGYAYVLRLESPELVSEAEKIQNYANAFGIRDNHFGSYKPHITIGYGPSPIEVKPPEMELDLGPSDVFPPKREVTSSALAHIWNFEPANHYHPWTGLPCNCFYGNYHNRHIRKTAGQYLNQAMKTHRKWLDSPEGSNTNEYLTTNFPEEYDALAPYIAQQSRRNNITYKRNDNGLFPYYDVNNEATDDPRFSLYERLPQWHQWFQARQHPTRQGVNVMDPNFHPIDFSRKVNEHQQALKEQHKRDQWIENYAPKANIVHRFGPEAGKYKNWQVAKLDANQAEGDSEALGHCIGHDDQPYKHNIDIGNIDAYSLRDAQGYPHVSWHFNPGGADIGHMQGKGGYPNEQYRNLISQFHQAYELPDEESDHEEELEPAYRDEYELPPATDMEEYVGHQNNPYDHVPRDDENQIGPETMIYAQDPDWDALAEDYLYRGHDPYFFDALEKSGNQHANSFAEAVERNMDPKDPEHRKWARFYNSEGPGNYTIKNVQDFAGNMDEYNDIAKNGNEPDVEDWDDLADNYLDEWKDYGPSGYQLNPLNPEEKENQYRQFMPAVQQWNHQAQMQRALKNMTQWENPFHQEAINHWNINNQQHGVYQDWGKTTPQRVSPDTPKLFDTGHIAPFDTKNYDNSFTWKNWDIDHDPKTPIKLYGNRKTSSMQEIADNLHEKYMLGTSPTDIVNYAQKLLGLVHYPNDEMSTQAALQAWQMLYPEDQILQHTSGWDFDSGFEKLIDQYAPYGLSCLYDETPEAIDISHLEVDPSLRSRGIGSKFMQAAHAYAQSVGKQLVISRVDNAPFFSKFPFLNQESEKRFVTAVWDNVMGQSTTTPIAAMHSGTIPEDEPWLNHPLDNMELNPNKGIHASYRTPEPNRAYVKPEYASDMHDDSPIKERAAFVLGHSMGMKVPHTVVRAIPSPGNPENQRFASVHQGIPNSMEYGSWLDKQKIRPEPSESNYKELLAQNVDKRRQMLLLDQIIGNHDRHSGNVVVDQNGEWYPIDHGGAFNNTKSHGPDWFFNYHDFEGQPLTPEEYKQVEAARATMDHPDNQELFSQPDLHPNALNVRVNTLLDTGKFQPFSWT